MNADLSLIPPADAVRPSDACGASGLADLSGFERLVRVRDSAYAADMLIAAVGALDFFTVLAPSRLTFDEICARFSLDRRACDVMLTLFKAWGLLVASDGTFRLTRTASRFLVATEPSNLVDYYASLRGRSSTKDMLEVLRTGRCRVWEREQAAEREEWAALMRKNGFAEFYTTAMDNRGMTFAAALAEIWDCSRGRSLLDIAGGSGIYTARLLQRCPLLRAEILEHPPVDAIARDLLAKRGLADRVKVTPGDMFTDVLPGGHDLHLYSHVLHNWDFTKVRDLISKSHRSLESPGQIAIFSAHVNAAKDGPVDVAEYSALMVSLYEGKCYSVGEMTECLQAAGFVDIHVVDAIAGRSLILGHKR